MHFHLLILMLWFLPCRLEHSLQPKKTQIFSDRDSDFDISRSTVGGNITKKLVSASQPIVLTCGKAGQDLSNTEIVWFFKPCSDGLRGKPCDLSDAGVVQICGAQRACPTKLTLDRPLPGIYRCFETGHKSGYTMTATVISTYILETIETKWELKFIKVPQNLMISVGKTARFECQVRSPHPVNVKWFRQVDEKYSHAIKYENRYYQAMNRTTTETKNDSYWSILEIKAVKMADYGTFACGVVFEGGIQYKEAHLSAPNSTNKDDELRKRSGETFSQRQQAIYVGAGTSFVGFLILLRFHCCLCCCRNRPQQRRVTIVTDKEGRSGRQRTAWGRLGEEVSMKATQPRPPYPGWTTTEPDTSDYERVVIV